MAAVLNDHHYVRIPRNSARACFRAGSAQSCELVFVFAASFHCTDKRSRGLFYGMEISHKLTGGVRSFFFNAVLFWGFFFQSELYTVWSIDHV